MHVGSAHIGLCCSDTSHVVGVMIMDVGLGDLELPCFNTNSH
jgi:hypothetical protein